MKPLSTENFTAPRHHGKGLPFSIDAKATAQTLRDLADAIDGTTKPFVSVQKAVHITLVSNDDFSQERLTLTFLRQPEHALTLENLGEKLGVEITTKTAEN